MLNELQYTEIWLIFEADIIFKRQNDYEDDKINI